MIVKVAARGSDPGKLMAYLASDKNLHCDQRIVAGSINYPGHLDKALTAQVEADLRAYQQLTGTKSAKGHIYHVTLALSPDERPITDQDWAEISDDFMAEMKFTDPSKADVRWTAVNHGHNAAGADHVHIVMSTIRQNGTQVSVHNDMIRASKVATHLEAKYGLKVLASRLTPVGAGSVPFTGREVEAARVEAKPEPDRVHLEREVRAIAAASGSEVEFVQRLRADGIMVRPYPKQGKVTGYSIAEPGVKPQWFAGGQLARDLTLPQLRRSWSGDLAAATAEWRFGTVDAPYSALPGARAAAPNVLIVEHEIGVLGEKIRSASPADLADLSHELAGTLAAASKATESVPGPLAKASRDVGGWAQPRVLDKSKRIAGQGAGIALLLIQAMEPGSAQSQAIMIRQLAAMTAALYRLHQASRPMVGVGKGMRMSVDSDATRQGVTAAATGVAAMANRRAGEKEATRPERKPRRSEIGDTRLWDADSIREYRVEAQVRKVREYFVPPEPRATPDQQRQLDALAAKVGIEPIVVGANAVPVDNLPQSDVERLIADFEASTQGLTPPSPVVLPDVETVSSKTHIGDIQTPEQADAFLAHLERQAEARAGVVDGSVETPAVAAEVTEPVAQSTTQPAATSQKAARDPRTWPTADDPITTKQRWTLQQAGFTPEEIATLKKGSASYVIGAENGMRKAFETNATQPIRQAQMPDQRSKRPSTDVRNVAPFPVTDIRNRQRPPTQ